MTQRQPPPGFAGDAQGVGAAQQQGLGGFGQLSTVPLQQAFRLAPGAVNGGPGVPCARRALRRDGTRAVLRDRLACRCLTLGLLSPLSSAATAAAGTARPAAGRLHAGWACAWLRAAWSGTRVEPGASAPPACPRVATPSATNGAPRAWRLFWAGATSRCGARASARPCAALTLSQHRSACFRVSVRLTPGARAPVPADAYGGAGMRYPGGGPGPIGPPPQPGGRQLPWL